MGQYESLMKRKDDNNFFKMDQTIFEEVGHIKSSFGENSPIIIIKNKLSNDNYLKKSIIQGLLENSTEAIRELQNKPEQ